MQSRDEFNEQSYDNNDGLNPWSGPWMEEDGYNDGGVETDPASGNGFAIISPAHLPPAFRVHVVKGGLGFIYNLIMTLHPVFGPFNIFQSQQTFIKWMLQPQIFANR